MANINSLYRNFMGGANNALASTIGAPVDLANRYMGNQPNALMGSQWIRGQLNNAGIGTEGHGIPGFAGGILGSVAIPGAGLLNAIDTSAQIAQAQTPGQMLLAAGSGLLGEAANSFAKQKTLLNIGNMGKKSDDFLQTYKINHPAMQKIADEISEKLPNWTPETDDLWAESFRNHPEYKTARTELIADKYAAAGKVGVSKLYKELSSKGIDVSIDESSSLGSNSTYLYAKNANGERIKIRLSNHEAKSSAAQNYGANQIDTTHQNWESALVKALKLLGIDK